MLKSKNRSQGEFKRIQALSICARVYPVRFEELKQKGRCDMALAIGFRIMNGLRK